MRVTQQQGGYTQAFMQYKSKSAPWAMLCKGNSLPLWCHEVFPPMMLPFRARLPVTQFSLPNSKYQTATSKINSKCNLVPLILLEDGKEPTGPSVKNKQTTCDVGREKVLGFFFFKETWKLNRMQVRSGQSQAPRGPAHLKPELEAHISLFPCQELLHPPWVELLVAEEKRAQGEDIVRAEYVGYRGM